MSEFFKEFGTFLKRGNVVELAVAFIIGVVFGKVISSFVADIIMPPIGLLLGGIDFSAFSLVIKKASGSQPAVLMRYGVFINTIVDFLVTAVAVFSVVHIGNKLRRADSRKIEPPKQTPEVIVLTKIMDLLSSRLGDEKK